MDEQRMQAYANLIKQLLGCAIGEKLAVLPQHAELVDAELLAVMQQYAADLDSQGNGNEARWLLETAKQLAQAMEITDAGAEESPEDSEQFLLEVLQLVANSKGNAQQVDRFLAQHQDKPNEPTQFQQWKNITISGNVAGVQIGWVRLPGDPSEPIPAPEFKCPQCDHTWYCPKAGIKPPLCPTHNVLLERA
ncbi:hypothetical protein LC653_23715 [Nostoc sp. CHAB 5784]|uniref:hypothetical protein n=1 Tax=Nostoc mirabile TaxID=2907820 RepID=UPI001E594283|nr:hypothetical protein [Nostoc mirabile]MCC5666816.1 hypothetical protein [Nostoc mirabile CHAB5784]